jgi:hypothetical protein
MSRGSGDQQPMRDCLASRTDRAAPEEPSQSQRSQSYWQECAEHIAPEVGTYVRVLFDAADVLSMLRTVQAVGRQPLVELLQGCQTCKSGRRPVAPLARMRGSETAV